MIVTLSPVIMFNHEVCFDAVPSEHQKRTDTIWYLFFFYCVKQYSLSVYCKIALMQFCKEEEYAKNRTPKIRLFISTFNIMQYLYVEINVIIC